MADSRIPLMTRVPDLFGALARGQEFDQTLANAPLIQQLNQQKVQAGQQDLAAGESDLAKARAEFSEQQLLTSGQLAEAMLSVDQAERPGLLQQLRPLLEEQGFSAHQIDSFPIGNDERLQGISGFAQRAGGTGTRPVGVPTLIDTPQGPAQSILVDLGNGQFENRVIPIQGEITDRQGRTSVERVAEAGERSRATTQGRQDVRAVTEPQIAGDVAREQTRARLTEEDRFAAEKRVRGADANIRKVDNVMGIIDEAIELVGPTTAGPAGAVSTFAPGTDAFTLRGHIDTIQANLSFQEIAQMRANSPTGGALGSVTERELDLLAATVSSIRQGLAPDALRAALGRVKTHYNNWRDAVIKARDRDIKKAGLDPRTGARPINELTNEELEKIANGGT